ncbi:MBL fold metallo-hydrolase [Roseovarius nubinhibens]|uniref:Metallo-beta-lactamase family protein n=1 Tax=Roseovarius nubinhibens (strain ATCC BAA-591 / DSM 15170 / ISM) TaxID=89187 RepID=A3SQJ6_ROSNI|nr:MBL fold metallo-hydrolase [Roseovarius nubinhibens]EAP75405.1 metallo-beta-lactamase family protein [Roseovarius nubinhibens ISM]
MQDMTKPRGIQMPWPTPPAEGEAVEIAPGLLWLRLPLPMALDHVNIYALDEGESWTVVDTGIHSKRAVALWEKILAGPLAGKPVSRVILTHHHPDHIGMAGWLMERFGAELWMSRTAWLMARMLILDVEEVPTEQALDYWRSAGMDPEIFETRRTGRPYNFADTSYPLPVGYRRLREGEVIRAGGRDWDVRLGNGHAPEHVTLWSRDDALVIAGDQIISSISPNIGVYPTEPEADPLAEWLESCERLAGFAREDHLVLSGHKLPFTGLPHRMRQLIDNHHGALRRLEAHLATPRTAAECFAPLFKRRIDAGTYGLALVEAVAHLNHLYQAGRITRARRADGAWLWQAQEGCKKG